MQRKDVMAVNAPIAVDSLYDVNQTLSIENGNQINLLMANKSGS
jgi:hypothetical protein